MNSDPLILFIKLHAYLTPSCTTLSTTFSTLSCPKYFFGSSLGFKSYEAKHVNLLLPVLTCTCSRSGTLSDSSSVSKLFSCFESFLTWDIMFMVIWQKNCLKVGMMIFKISHAVGYHFIWMKFWILNYSYFALFIGETYFFLNYLSPFFSNAHITYFWVVYHGQNSLQIDHIGW